MEKRVHFKLELLSRGALALPYLSGLKGAVVKVQAGPEARTGTVRAVHEMGIELDSLTGTRFGFPWEGIDQLELLDR